jgi:hypothetical protein
VLQLACGLISRGGIVSGGALDHADDRIRQIGPQIAEPPADALRMSGFQRIDRAALHRYRAGEQEEQQDAETVDVGGHDGVVPVKQFRRHEQRRAGEHRRPGVVRHRLGTAEVHQDDPAAGLAHDVVRLDVAVQQTCRMQGGQRAAQVAADSGHLVRAHGAAVADDRGQRLPFDELHPDPDVLVVLIRAIDGDDVGVPDAREIARLRQR